jgi:hypothetical protein
LRSTRRKILTKASAAVVDAVAHQAHQVLAVREVVADVAAVSYAPVSLDVTHTLMMRQYNEMRRAIASEESKTRVYMRNLAIAMALLVFVMSIVVMVVVYVIVYRLKEPAVCDLSPPMFNLNCTVVTDLVEKAKYFAGEFTKSARDDWAH